MTMPDSVSGVAGKPRDVNYDLLRVVAMCLVIGVHVINNYMPVKMTLAGSAEVTRSVLFALFMVCNPLFIMVSGRFNLTFDADRPVSTHSAGRLPGSGSDARAGGGAGQADPSSLAPYARYYYKRFVSLIVPYLLYAGGMGFVAYLVIDHRSVGGAVSGTLFDLFSGYDDSVYWFVFMLAGFVLATPFLAAMMRTIGRSGAGCWSGWPPPWPLPNKSVILPDIRWCSCSHSHGVDCWFTICWALCWNTTHLPHAHGMVCMRWHHSPWPGPSPRRICSPVSRFRSAARLRLPLR